MMMILRRGATAKYRARPKSSVQREQMLRQAKPEPEEEALEASGSEGDSSWVQWFCSLKGNEFFAEVDAEFMQDDFNLTGLSAQVPYYEYALDTVMDAESLATANFSKEQQESIESAAELLYGLIHARYIITPLGMAAMLEKFKHCHFGRCPRVHCQGQPALPVGQSDLPRMHATKIFCPRCQDIFYPRSSRQANVDGAYFGTSFCHLFLQSYWELVPTPPVSSYVPRIFGFKIHKSAREAAIAAAKAAATAAVARSSAGAGAGGDAAAAPSPCATATTRAATLPSPPPLTQTSTSTREVAGDSGRDASSPREMGRDGIRGHADGRAAEGKRDGNLPPRLRLLRPGGAVRDARDDA